MTTHTPEEWYVSKLAGNHQAAVASMTNGATVALIYNADNGGASLIAAAPDLLEACYSALNFDFAGIKWPEGFDAEYHFTKLRVAIAKAEGR